MYSRRSLWIGLACKMQSAFQFPYLLNVHWARILASTSHSAFRGDGSAPEWIYHNNTPAFVLGTQADQQGS